MVNFDNHDKKYNAFSHGSSSSAPINFYREY